MDDSKAVAPPLFDFDEGPSWLGSLRRHLAPALSVNVGGHLRSAQPEGPWAARSALAEVSDLAELYERAREWLEARDVVGYHGTRLDAEQRDRVAREGLVPLAPEERVAALTRFLSPHPRWHEVRHRLPEAIEFIGGGGAGNRSGQVHLTLSGAGLLRGFNHYLVEGSEFDHHVANYLLGEECHDLNRARGCGLLYRVRIDGKIALAAANPFGQLTHPNLLNEIIQSFAWSLTTGREDTDALELDCGMILYEGVAPHRIIDVTAIDNDELWPHYDHRAR